MGVHNLNAVWTALKHRYSRGRVLSFSEAMEKIGNGQYIYWYKPEHPDWMAHMKIVTVMRACDDGQICEAVPNE